MEDKRRSIRKETAWPAQVCTRNGVIPATIVDLSAAGARVHLSEAVVLASQCHLKASLFTQDVRCKVVWQIGSEIGLSFVVPAAPGAARLRRGPIAP